MSFGGLPNEISPKVQRKTCMCVCVCVLRAHESYDTSHGINLVPLGNVPHSTVHCTLPHGNKPNNKQLSPSDGKPLFSCSHQKSRGRTGVSHGPFAFLPTWCGRVILSDVRGGSVPQLTMSTPAELADWASATDTHQVL